MNDKQQLAEVLAWALARDCKVWLPSTGEPPPPMPTPVVPPPDYGGNGVDSLDGRDLPSADVELKPPRFPPLRRGAAGQD